MDEATAVVDELVESEPEQVKRHARILEWTARTINPRTFPPLPTFPEVTAFKEAGVVQSISDKRSNYGTD